MQELALGGCADICAIAWGAIMSLQTYTELVQCQLSTALLYSEASFDLLLPVLLAASYIAACLHTEQAQS